MVVGRLNILLVDPDVVAREKICQALDQEFTLRCVSSVQEAFLALLEWLPDIVVSEVDLRGESGLALCQDLRASAETQHLPLLFLTSRATIQDKIAGFDAGTDDYVVKPFDARHLAARIRLLSRIKKLELHKTGRPVYPGK